MLSMDKEAIKELTEMEAVPICNILGSLLGRSVKMSVSKAVSYTHLRAHET